MLKSVFFSIIGILLLCAMNAVINEMSTQSTFHLITFLQLNILYFLFGVLIQWKKVERILNQKSIQLNHLIFPALLLIAIMIIPNTLWTDWFGQNPIVSLFLIKPLTYADTHSIIGALSGSLFIKALDN